MFRTPWLALLFGCTRRDKVAATQVLMLYDPLADTALCNMQLCVELCFTVFDEPQHAHAADVLTVIMESLPQTYLIHGSDFELSFQQSVTYLQGSSRSLGSQVH